MGIVDSEKFSKLYLSCRGNRTDAEFARMLGVHPSTVCRIKNKQVKSSCNIELVRNMYRYRYDVENVTYEDLLIANGNVVENSEWRQYYWDKNLDFIKRELSDCDISYLGFIDYENKMDYSFEIKSNLFWEFKFIDLTNRYWREEASDWLYHSAADSVLRTDLYKKSLVINSVYMFYEIIEKISLIKTSVPISVICIDADQNILIESCSNDLNGDSYLPELGKYNN